MLRRRSTAIHAAHAAGWRDKQTRGNGAVSPSLARRSDRAGLVFMLLFLQGCGQPDEYQPLSAAQLIVGQDEFPAISCGALTEDQFVLASIAVGDLETAQAGGRMPAWLQRSAGSRYIGRILRCFVEGANG